MADRTTCKDCNNNYQTMADMTACKDCIEKWKQYLARYEGRISKNHQFWNEIRRIIAALQNLLPIESFENIMGDTVLSGGQKKVIAEQIAGARKSLQELESNIQIFSAFNTESVTCES